jgi:hypothetical protein
MKYCFFLLSISITSCQLKDANQIKKVSIDTGQAKAIHIDSSIQINPAKNDTIFLAYRIGMTKSEFQVHTKELIRKKKLFASGMNFLYLIQYDESSSANIANEMFGHPAIPEQISTEKGYMEPEFFEEKLISISIIFKNTNGNNVWSFFFGHLCSKYPNKKMDVDKYTAADIDTLSIGRSIDRYVKSTWITGDIQIILKMDRQSLKVSNKKFKDTDNVILKYWSTSSYETKSEKETIEQIKNSKQIQSDL